MKKEVFIQNWLIIGIGISGLLLAGFLLSIYSIDKTNCLEKKVESTDPSLGKTLKSIPERKPLEPIIPYPIKLTPARTKASQSNFQPQVVSCSSSDCHK